MELNSSLLYIHTYILPVHVVRVQYVYRLILAEFAALAC